MTYFQRQKLSPRDSIHARQTTDALTLTPGKIMRQGLTKASSGAAANSVAKAERDSLRLQRFG
ncbi:MAG: hypothetical protein CSH36_09050 [Thalassolituus sp.]|nr:MAG: hypothetical protein CSH36_09050 [Thalassolituus sp.]